MEQCKEMMDVKLYAPKDRSTPVWYYVLCDLPHGHAGCHIAIGVP